MDAYTQAARKLLNLSSRAGVISESDQYDELDVIVSDLKGISASYKEKKAKPWYIRSHDHIGVTPSNPMYIQVEVFNSLTDDSKDSSETLEPPFEDFEIDRIEEHGGLGYGQQSIVINITEAHTEREACIQVEIDPETGNFKESSLDGWEIHSDGIEDDDGDDD